MHIEKLIILGSGPAGLTAAIYAARAGLHPMIFEGTMPGGQLMGTTHVENWPGEISILGPELMKKMRDHAAHFNTRFNFSNIIDIDLKSKPFKLIDENNKNFYAHSIIIATGAQAKKLRCSGEDEYWAKGVSTCAVCDGAFYKDRPVVIVGGGDTSMEEASFMTNFTDNITVVHITDKLTASHAMQERVLKNPKIKIIYNSTVTKINGNGEHVTDVIIKNMVTNQETNLKTDAVFVAIGLTPNTALFKGQIELTNYGHIKLTDHTRTSIEGVFAAGDVADAKYRQAITSAGTGCAAALDAEKFLKENGL